MRRVCMVVIVLALIATACTPSDEVSGTTTTSTTPTGPIGSSPPPSPPEIIPLLATLGDDSTVAGQTVFLMSRVLASEPIRRLELWVNGEKVDEVEFDEPTDDPPFSWEWVPGSIGLQAAAVRAINESGEVAESFPTWFRVEAPVDTETGAPIGDLPASPLGTPTDKVTMDAEACSATFEVAAAPDQLGLYVTASSFGVAGSAAVAVLPAAGGEVSMPLTGSPVIVSVLSYDESKADPEATIIVPGAPDCAMGTWEGAMGFDGSVLVGGAGFDATSLDATYLYVTEDDSTWFRVPDTGFVTRGRDGFDYAGLLPQVAPGGHLEVEVWGRGARGLEGLGRGRFTATSGGPAEAMWGGAVQPVTPYSSLNIVRQAPIIDSSGFTETLLLSDVVCSGSFFNPDCGPDPSTVRWNSGLTGADAGLVQVSTTPLPTEPAISFPGLLWSIEFAMDGAATRDVELPLKEVVAGTWLPKSTGTGATPTPEFSLVAYSQFEAMALDFGANAPTAPPGATARVGLPFLGNLFQNTPPDRIWVRVIPLIDDLPVAGASNVVQYRVEDEALVLSPDAQQLFDSYYTTQIEFTQPQRGNDTFARCVRVVENPFGKENPVPDEFPWNAFGTQTWQAEFNVFRDWAGVWTAQGKQSTGLVPGATVCARHPDPPDDDFFDFVGDAIAFVGDVWDTFKNMVDMIKAGIIEGIVDIVGCEPKSTCVAALTALADAGLAAVGVPPTLPSFNEFIEAAKGDIASALAKELVGQSCGAIPCEEFAKDFIDDALDDIQGHFSDMAVSNSNSDGWELLLNPGIIVVPEPAGQLFLGSAKVTFTRTAYSNPSFPAPAFCAVSLTTEGSGFVDWTEKGGLISHVNGAVQGVVVAAESTTANLSKLAPGESLTVGVSGLDFDRFAYLKGTEPFQGGFKSQEKLKSLALFADPDTTLTMVADVCGKQFTDSAKLKSIAGSPADIPTK